MRLVKTPSARKESSFARPKTDPAKNREVAFGGKVLSVMLAEPAAHLGDEKTLNGSLVWPCNVWAATISYAQSRDFDGKVAILSCRKSDFCPIQNLTRQVRTSLLQTPVRFGANAFSEWYMRRSHRSWDPCRALLSSFCTTNELLSLFKSAPFPSMPSISRLQGVVYIPAGLTR